MTPSAGAFLAGSLIASLPNAKEYGKAIHPYAIIFTSIFFMAMGTLVDFPSLKDNLMIIAILLVTVIVAQFVAVGLVTFFLANFRNEQPIFASIAMMSIGEFSLLVAKESQKFGLGIDLVTITAAIIFLSAILMSLSINYSEPMHNAFNSIVPIRPRLRLEKLSDYMRRLFDQLEIENFSTKKLRVDSKFTLMLSIIALFAFFILRRASLVIKAGYPAFVLYIFYAIGAALMVYLLSLVYTRLKSLHNTLSVILTNVDSSRNLKKCKKILDNLLIAFALFFSAMLFPFAMFAFNFNAWANIVPFAFIIAAFYFIRDLFMLIDGSSHISYGARLAAAKI